MKAPEKREGRAARGSSLEESKAYFFFWCGVTTPAKGRIRGLKKAGHSQTELSFSLLFDFLLPRSPLFNLSSPNTESLNQSAAVFSATAENLGGLPSRRGLTPM